MQVAEYKALADTLKAKIDHCTDEIEDINEQEDAFEWEITQYPAKTGVANTLEPYVNTLLSYQNR